MGKWGGNAFFDENRKLLMIEYGDKTLYAKENCYP